MPTTTPAISESESQPEPVSELAPSPVPQVENPDRPFTHRARHVERQTAVGGTSTRTTEMAADDPVGALFASRSLPEHVLRGVLGLVLVVTAFALAGSSPWALLLAVPGVVAWRGCPTCWTLGLLATASRGRAGCVDGTCHVG